MSERNKKLSEHWNLFFSFCYWVLLIVDLTSNISNCWKYSRNVLLRYLVSLHSIRFHSIPFIRYSFESHTQNWRRKQKQRCNRWREFRSKVFLSWMKNRKKLHFCCWNVAFMPLNWFLYINAYIDAQKCNTYFVSCCHFTLNYGTNSTKAKSFLMHNNSFNSLLQWNSSYYLWEYAFDRNMCKSNDNRWTEGVISFWRWNIEESNGKNVLVIKSVHFITFQWPWHVYMCATISYRLLNHTKKGDSKKRLNCLIVLSRSIGVWCNNTVCIEFELFCYKICSLHLWS